MRQKSRSQRIMVKSSEVNWPTLLAELSTAYQSVMTDKNEESEVAKDVIETTMFEWNLQGVILNKRWGVGPKICF